MNMFGLAWDHVNEKKKELFETEFRRQNNNDISSYTDALYPRMMNSYSSPFTG
jgi:hypothetical protein